MLVPVALTDTLLLLYSTHMHPKTDLKVYVIVKSQNWINFFCPSITQVE